MTGRQAVPVGGAPPPLDAVGRPVRVGDAVTTLSGKAVSRSVVERVAGQRLLCRRGDGMKAIFKAGGVVVLQRRRQDVQEAQPGGLAS